MENVKDIFIVLLLGSASVLCLALVYYISRVTKAVESIQTDLERISSQVNPLLESLNSLSKSIKILSEDVRSQVSKVSWIIDEIKDKFEQVASIEHKVREFTEHPAQNVMSLVTFLREKITSLWKRK